MTRGTSWWLLGFIAHDSRERGLLVGEGWRYPEFQWSQWLPGLQSTHGEDVVLMELWVCANDDAGADWIRDSALTQRGVLPAGATGFNVLGIEDNGRLVPLADGVAETPLESAYLSLREPAPMSQEGAQRLLHHVVEKDRGYLDHRIPWFIATHRIAGDTMGDEALRAPVEALVSMALDRGLEASAVVAASGRPWFQFALTSPHGQASAECYVGAEYASAHVLRPGGDGKSVTFEWSTASLGSVQQALAHVVDVVAQISLGRFRVRPRLLRAPEMLVRGSGGRRSRGRMGDVGRGAEGPLSFTHLTSRRPPAG